MLFAMIQFVVLAVVIIAAGTMLARYGDGIAEATGLGRLLIGSVLLAGATSLPELTVDISAVRLNLPDMAMGDLLGSSLMNLLILAALDLTTYSGGKMLSRTAAAHALSGLFSIALTGVVGLGLLTSRRAGHWTFLGAHAGCGLWRSATALECGWSSSISASQRELPRNRAHCRKMLPLQCRFGRPDWDS